MERFSALSRGTQLMFIGSILLLIDSFLSWQKYDGHRVRIRGAAWCERRR